jgi:hypothetical protein
VSCSSHQHADTAANYSAHPVRKSHHLSFRIFVARDNAGKHGNRVLQVRAKISPSLECQTADSRSSSW